MPEQVDQIINKITGTVDAEKQNTKNDNDGSGKLLYCDAINQLNLNSFVDREKPKLVALVGFADYGKSTFIGTLYQQLINNQKFKDYAFVDSDTYVGFERRVFLRRINGDDISDTKRNVLKENDILDFKLRSDKGVFRVLVSDKAGETYTKYTSSDEEIGRDVVIENADLMVLFVDADADSRSLAEHNLIVEKYVSLLTRLKAQKKITEGLKYLVVFTKADKVQTEDRKRRLAERKNLICSSFTEVLGIQPIDVYEVNSKDLNNAGLNSVFEKILSPKQQTESCREMDWVKMEIEKR